MSSQKFFKPILYFIIWVAISFPLLFGKEISAASENNASVSKLLPVIVSIASVVSKLILNVACGCCSKHLESCCLHLRRKFFNHLFEISIDCNYNSLACYLAAILNFYFPTFNFDSLSVTIQDGSSCHCFPRHRLSSSHRVHNTVIWEKQSFSFRTSVPLTRQVVSLHELHLLFAVLYLVLARSYP